MQLHRQKIWTFLTVCMMIVTLLSSCGTASPPSTASNPTATATSELKLGVYKSGNGLVNAYGEKLYVQSTPELTQKYKNLPPPVQLSLSNTHYTGKQATHLIALVKQSTSSTGSCGQEGAPSDNAYNVRDVIDNLPTAASADTNVSDPFLLLASEVSYQEENSVTVTSDELINSCTEQFNPETGGIAYDLPFLNHPGNWDAILQAYQQNYPNDYQPMWDALNTFKARATKYAQDNGLPINEGQATPTPTEEPPTPTEVQPTPTDQPPTPTPTEVQPTPTQGPGSGTVGQIVEAPASILDEPDWDKHHVLMPEQEWQDTSFPESGISDATKWLDAIQLVIDMGGMVPAFSAINGVNTLIYLIPHGVLSCHSPFQKCKHRVI